MNKDCNPIEQQARQEEFDRLYELDGRNDPNHPLHATYAGLYESSRASAGADETTGAACPC